MAHAIPTDAESFVRDGDTVGVLVESLARCGIEATEQDWNSGSTTWTFPDGSRIRITGTEIETLAAEA